MNPPEFLSRLLADLAKVKEVCSRDDLESLPDSAVAYISANRQEIAVVIQQVYSKTDRSQRAQLAKERSELHASVIDEAWGKEASKILEDAAITKELRRTGTGDGVSAEDLDVLLRILRYGKYIASDPKEFDLRNSPIEKHGLKPRYGNFLSPTEQEWSQVPWALADIVLDEEWKKFNKECRDLGLDLDNRELKLVLATYPETVARVTELALGLYNFRVQTDWAAVMSVPKVVRDNYVNDIVRRLKDVDGRVIVRLRESLEKDVRFFTALVRPGSHERISVEPSLAPLIRGYKDLLSKIPDIYPTVELCGLILKLKQYNQQGVPPTLFIQKWKGDFVAGDKGDNVTGDKNVFKQGQGVQAPGGIVVGNTFNQLWDQSGQQEKLPELAEQLKSLREAMRTREGGPEKDVALGNVASAEMAARKGDGPQVLEYLSKAGKWAFDAATDIGTHLAAAVIGKSMGLPG
jgi:hypothetical protein